MMPIERITNKEQVERTRIRIVRSRDVDEPGVSYILTWKVWASARKRFVLRTIESKPTNDFREATEKFERRKAFAVIVELSRYDDDGSLVIRRFCNIRKYESHGWDSAWILNEKNPPYEIERG